MFTKSFGNVTVQTVSAPKRGFCLEASCAGGEKIYMDFCGMNPMLVPDGTNAYFFGNKLIMVTRWSDMTEAEKHTVETDDMVLVLHPYQCIQLSFKINNAWNDVMVNLHHCYSGLNDENAPVDEIIFIFSDTHDSDYIISRSVKLPEPIQNFLQKGNSNSHKQLQFDDKIEALRAYAEQDSTRDFWDLLYDACWEETKDRARKARAQEPDNVPDGIYIEISSSNEVTNFYQHEYAAAKPMSNEVKMYLKLAEAGIADGQYNLGVCYEQGDGVEQDFKQAVHWYRKAADQNHAKAQYNLGVCIYNGCGVQADHAEAARLFLASAEQGDMYAQFNMGVCCYTGDGVAQNILSAMEWFKKAADQGHPEAKKLIGG